MGSLGPMILYFPSIRELKSSATAILMAKMFSLRDSLKSHLEIGVTVSFSFNWHVVWRGGDSEQGRIVEEGSSSAQAGGAQPSYVPPFGGIPIPASYYGGPQMQAWGVVHRCPTKLCGAQRNLRGALRTISPTTTKHGRNWRVCCEKHAKHCCHPIQRGSTW
jgi:hypothetical protein